MLSNIVDDCNILVNQKAKSISTLLKNTRIKIRALISLLLIISGCVISGCATEQPAKISQPTTPIPSPSPIQPALSPMPIAEVTELDIRFVQAALNQLGFDVGKIDGLWGPKSANAINLFESAYQLMPSNGYISELNLSKLTEVSSVRREQIIPQLEAPQNPSSSLEKKLAEQPESTLPRLIVTDEDYSILSKTNPYSQVVQKVPAGTGIYVIDLKNGWYQIETLDRKVGFLQK